MRSRACKGPLPGSGPRLLAPSAMAVLVLASMLGGCSQAVLIFRGEAASDPVSEEPVVTGSIARRPVSFGDDLAEEDWRRARAALAVALDPQGNGRPVRWDNPETGLHGAINPTGLPYVAEDLICRNFLASVIGPGRSRFVRGTGCKPSGGDWSLKRVHNAAAPAGRS